MTPLGWTCVGPLENEASSPFTFNTAHLQTLDKNIQKFWEIENEGIVKANNISPKDTVVLARAEESIRFTDGKYDVALPWKQEHIELPDNFEMAKKRLESTKKKD